MAFTRLLCVMGCVICDIMTQEKWLAIKGKIMDAMEVLDRGEEHYAEEGGVDVDFIEFQSPLGKTRLEFIVKPIVLDKKTVYSHRGGSDTGVEYVYSPTEKSSRLAVYKWDDDDGEWLEISADNFTLP
jgi:hypothetical protein